MIDLADVARAWGWEDAEIEPITRGLINLTYGVRRGGEHVAVLQRLHPVFGATVNLDIEAVTTHLAARGLPTPRLLRTRAGAPWVEHGGIWRALSWIEGTTVHTIPDLGWAEAGGALVGRFHRAVDDLAHEYQFTRAGVHDTDAHLATLRASIDDALPEAAALAREILATAEALPPMPDTPRRHTHGDLKISNVIFRNGAGATDAVCLVDLDTVGRATLAFELGDAMRSWCNPFGEDRGAARFDPAIFGAAMRAWRDVAGALVTREELASVVVGLETVCVELAARFCADVFRDTYFGWDPTRFASRREHNLVRARGQLALAASVREQRDAAMAVMLGDS